MPPHFHENVWDILDLQFPGWWNGQAAPISWPPPLELTPMDCYFWGFIKNEDYQLPLATNVTELNKRIIATDSLQSVCVWQQTEYHWDVSWWSHWDDAIASVKLKLSSYNAMFSAVVIKFYMCWKLWSCYHYELKLYGNHYVYLETKSRT